MALPPLATVVNLSDWIGEPIVEEEDVKRAGAVLRAASTLVRAFTGARWADESGMLGDVPDGVNDVVLAVAGRGYTNPEGWSGERQDDWGGSGRKVEEAGLYLTASERLVLDQHRPAKVSGIGFLATTRVEARAPGAGWVPTEDGPLFPWY